MEMQNRMFSFILHAAFNNFYKGTAVYVFPFSVLKSMVYVFFRSISGNCAEILFSYGGCPYTARSEFVFLPLAWLAFTSIILTGSKVCKRQLPPKAEKIFACKSFPLSHLISTVKFPLALTPLIVPFGHAEGSAGNNVIAPSWLCNNISVMPAV